jgi:ribulose 1,5-bisphosphate carboxylase large subunit-like protein
MDQVFGPVYAKSLAHDLVIGALGGLTSAGALAEGVAPRTVWHALCDAMEVEESARWVYRDAPRGRRGR